MHHPVRVMMIQLKSRWAWLFPCCRRLMTHIKRELIRWMKPRKLQRMRFGRCVMERQVTFGLISQMEQM